MAACLDVAGDDGSDFRVRRAQTRQFARAGREQCGEIGRRHDDARVAGVVEILDGDVTVHGRSLDRIGRLGEPAYLVFTIP